jgi:hypothetical protein
MTEVIYSQQRNGFVEGRTYLNPRFFERPMPGVDKVLIVGDWPKIAHAYAALNIPVEIVGGDQVRAVAGAEVAPHPLVEAISDLDERAKVYIPDDWASLPWSRPTDAGLTLRGLAAVFADTPVLNKEDARNAIGAELARRAEGAEMREHIHVPAHDEHVHQPAWNEPSRDADGRSLRDAAAE